MRLKIQRTEKNSVRTNFFNRSQLANFPRMLTFCFLIRYFSKERKNAYFPKTGTHKENDNVREWNHSSREKI